MYYPLSRFNNKNAMFKIIVYTFILIMGFCFSAPLGYCADPLDSVFTYDSKGKRDPFVPLIGQERVMGASLETITSPDDIKLEGIATGGGGKRIAIINGQMVKENDKFGGLIIKSILRTSVELSIEGRDYTLTLQEPEKTNADDKK